MGDKVHAVLTMPPPSNVTSLKSFLGALQFYSKFCPNLSTLAEPLYRLTRKDVKWQWEGAEKESFEKCKESLCSNTLLAVFNPGEKLGISCDASSVGVGSVLFHRYADGSERPIFYVSKTLTETQRKYSQIHKEALSIIFALQKFHIYLFARKFILVTDAKPLLSLFNPQKATPVLAANRLSRWALILSQYDYSIEYRKTSAHSNADVLSRLPSGPDDNFDEKECTEDIDTICLIKMVSRQISTDSKTLSRETAKDAILSAVMRYTREGWPSKSSEHGDEIENYRKLSDSLSMANGCLLFGIRIIIPTSMRENVLNLLHIGHFGISRMKRLARTAVYWPNIDSDITSLSNKCSTCAEHQNNPAKAPNHPWMYPEKPWSRIHVDHAIYFLGTNWLVVTDAHSKYPCIHATNSVSTEVTITLLEEDFAHFGYPHSIVSDNSTTFTSEAFKNWCRERGITHLTGAPYFPATNGSTERLIQTFKKCPRK